MPEFRHELEAEAHAAIGQRHDTLKRICRALYGAEWVSPAGRDLGVAQRTIQRWASGETPVPHGVITTDLPRIARERGTEIIRECEERIAAIRSVIASGA